MSETASGDDAVTRMTASGRELWRRALPSATRVAIGDLGDSVVAGSFAGSLTWEDAALTSAESSAGFVARLDENGGVSWAHLVEAEGGGLTATALVSGAEARTAALFRYGFTLPSSEPNPVQREGFLLVELDSAGNELWRQQVWDAGAYVVGTDLTFDPSGNVVVSATVNQGSIDFGLGPVSAGNPLTSFLAKFGADGSPLWSRTLANASARVQSVVSDDRGNSKAAGWIGNDGPQYTTKPFLTEVGADGSVGATTSFDTGAQNDGIKVARGACGGVFVVINSTLSAGTWSAAIVEVPDNNGAPKTFALSPAEWVNAAAVDRNGALVLTGNRPNSPPTQAFVTRWRQ